MGIVGSVLKNRYEIIAELGKGGMSTVYLARDKNLGSYWAIKQVKNIRSVDMDAFKKEVELLSTLNHSDVPRIVDRIEEGNNYFVCMDFIDGTPLSKKVAAEGPAAEEKLVEWAKMLCDVLSYLHTVRKNPIVYRDMKPDNIMLTASGRVKLIDFGIALECIRGKAPSGAKVGTKGYAAPEQYSGEPLDERTDIYSLGVTLYYLVTGNAPENPPNAIKPIREINPKLSEGLEYIINKCTQVHPSDRYQNCMELKYDLENIDTLNSKYRKTMRRRLTAFVASFLCFIVSLGFVVIGNSGINKAKREDYLYWMRQGSDYYEGKDYKNAEQAYIDAAKYKPTEPEPYLNLMEVYSSQSTDKNDAVKNAIVNVERMIGDKASPVYNNSEILYKLARLCLEVNDVNYARKAYDYFDLIKADAQYSEEEINSYKIMAMSVKDNFDEKGYEDLSTALQALEDYSDKLGDVNKKLNNYLTITTMYSMYKGEGRLTNANDKIISITEKARNIIGQTDPEILEFNDEIVLIERAATSYYARGLSSPDNAKKKEDLEKSLGLFKELEDMGVTLSDTLELRVGNIYRGIFETYTPAEKVSMVSILNNAVQRYSGILSKEPSNVEAAVRLSDTYLDIEMVKINEKDRNFTNAQAAYKNAEKMQDSIKSAAFRSLKKRMEALALV
jgi:serine/threonine-protein kinase